MTDGEEVLEPHGAIIERVRVSGSSLIHIQIPNGSNMQAVNEFMGALAQACPSCLVLVTPTGVGIKMIPLDDLRDIVQQLEKIKAGIN